MIVGGLIAVLVPVTLVLYVRRRRFRRAASLLLDLEGERRRRKQAEDALEAAKLRIGYLESLVRDEEKAS